MIQSRIGTDILIPGVAGTLQPYERQSILTQ